MNVIRQVAVIITALLASAVAVAEINDSKPLLCALWNYSECTTDGCYEVAAANINAPRFIKVDVKRKRIEPVEGGGGVGRTSRIDHIERIDGKLIVQGVEDGVEGVRDGLGYSIAISQETGDLALSASADGAAFVAFGACTLAPK